MYNKNQNQWSNNMKLSNAYMYTYWKYRISEAYIWDAPSEKVLSPCKLPGHKGQEFLWTKVPKAQPSELKLHSVTMKYVFSNLFSAYQKKKKCAQRSMFLDQIWLFIRKMLSHLWLILLQADLLSLPLQ